MRSTRQSGGYIALMAVLIVGAASLAIGLALLTMGADSQRSTLIAQQSAQARSLATACAEEALQEIHDDTAFTGTDNLSLGQGTCSYTVTNTGGNNRTITASGVVGEVTRKLEIYATIGVSSISIISWQEIS
jgi:DeoR/GlpR family transcriptional regulator of sugar metabolism